MSDDDHKNASKPADLLDMASHWSLAGDKKLLQVLQSIHKNITERVDSTQSRLEQMSAVLDEATIKYEIVNNRFMSLGNTQYIENRVQEDNTDIEEVVKEPSNSDVGVSETKALPDIKNALLSMESYFEKLEIVADSESEDESEGGVSEVMLLKDQYESRALPYIIGSKGWTEKSDIGLKNTGESDSEEEIDIPVKTIRYPGSEDGNSGISDDRCGRNIMDKPSTKSQEVSTSLENSIENIRKIESFPKIMNPTKLAKFANPILLATEPPPLIFPDSDDNSADSDNSDSPVRSKEPVKPVKIVKSEPRKLENSESGDEIFVGVKKTDPLQKLTIAKEIETDDKSPSERKTINVESNVGESRNDVISTENTEKSKKPVGAKSVFGSRQGNENIAAAILKSRRKLSSNESDYNDPKIHADKVQNPSSNVGERRPLVNVKDNLNENAFIDNKINKLKGKVNEINIDTHKNTSNKTIDQPLETTEKSEKTKNAILKDLFLDLNDDDLFSSILKSKPSHDSKKETTSTSLFDEDDGLFSIKKVSDKSVTVDNVKTKSNNDDKQETKKNNVYVGDNSLFSVSKDMSEKTTKVASYKTVSMKEKQQKKERKSLFDKDDGLLSGNKQMSENKKQIIGDKTRSMKHQVTKKKTLFDDEDDDLFSADDKVPENRKQIIGDETKLMKEEETMKKALFDDDDNGLLSGDETVSESRKQIISDEIKLMKDQETKKKTLFDDEDNGLLSGVEKVSESRKQIISDETKLMKDQEENNNPLFDIDGNGLNDRTVRKAGKMSPPRKLTPAVSSDGDEFSKTGQSENSHKKLKTDSEKREITARDTRPANKKDLTNDIGSKSIDISTLKSKTEVKKVKSLFGDSEDDEDDIFRSVLKKKSENATQKSQVKTKIRDSLFESEHIPVLIEKESQDIPILKESVTEALDKNVETEDKLCETKEIITKEKKLTPNVIQSYSSSEKDFEKLHSNVEESKQIFHAPPLEKTAESNVCETADQTFETCDNSNLESIVNKTENKIIEKIEIKKSANITKSTEQNTESGTKLENQSKPFESQSESKNITTLSDYNESMKPKTDYSFDKMPPVRSVDVDDGSVFDNYDDSMVESVDDTFNQPLPNSEDDYKPFKVEVKGIVKKFVGDENIIPDLPKPQKTVGKLKTNSLNINVNTLLPGALPKLIKNINKTPFDIISDRIDQDIENHDENSMNFNVNNENDDEKNKKIDQSKESSDCYQRDITDSSKVNKGEVKDSIEKSESLKFETELLNNDYSKEKTKISVKRRPSTRRARLNALKVASPDIDIDSTDCDNTCLEKSNSEFDVQDSPVLRDKSLLENSLKTATSSVISDTTIDSANKTNTEVDDENRDDLIFNINTLGKVYKDARDDKDESKQVLNKDVGKILDKKHDIFDDSSDEDLFKPVKKTEATNAPNLQSYVTKNYTEKVDASSEISDKISDKSKSTSSKAVKIKKKKSKTNVKPSIFDDSSEDDLFSGKKVTKLRETKIVNDYSKRKTALFDDTDSDADVFGAVASKSVPKKVYSKSDKAQTPPKTASKEQPTISSAETVYKDPLSFFSDEEMF